MDTDINSPINRVPTAAPLTPFPSTQQPGTAAAPAAARTGAIQQTAAPGDDTVLRRVTQRAHDAVDGLSAKLEGAQDKVDQALQTREEWTAAARDAIREHPLLALGGALLVGAALNALLPSRRDR